MLANLIQSLGDDQTAILGGLAAMFAAGGVMYLSYFVGPVARQERLQRREQAVRQQPQPIRRAEDRAA